MSSLVFTVNGSQSTFDASGLSLGSLNLANGSAFVSLRLSSSSLNYSLTLPAEPPIPGNGSVLQSNASGNLVWAALPTYSTNTTLCSWSNGTNHSVNATASFTIFGAMVSATVVSPDFGSITEGDSISSDNCIPSGWAPPVNITILVTASGSHGIVTAPMVISQSGYFFFNGSSAGTAIFNSFAQSWSLSS